MSMSMSIHSVVRVEIDRVAYLAYDNGRTYPKRNMTILLKDGSRIDFTLFSADDNPLDLMTTDEHHQAEEKATEMLLERDASSAEYMCS